VNEPRANDGSSLEKVSSEGAPPTTVQSELSVDQCGMTGYELVTRVLDHLYEGFEELIKLADRGEIDRLEFKAAMVGRLQDRKNRKKNGTQFFLSEHSFCGTSEK